MRKQNHYFKSGHTEYIFNAEYYPNNDSINITVKIIENNEMKQIELNDPAVRSIISMYNQLKFEVK